MNLKNFFLYSFFPLALIFASEENLTTYTLEDYIIKSSPISLTTGDNSQSSKIILNKTLDDLRSDTIADTLSFQSGISKTYYGPNANRPIIRGLDGYRVGILENGLMGFDLSATSNDHAVTINPLLIDRIEILKGSACLVHCGNSIAGLINVFDKSIPNLKQGALLENQFRTRFSSVNDGRNFGGIVFDQIGNLVFQINGSKVKTSDYNAPKFEVHHHEHHHHIQYANASIETDSEGNISRPIIGKPGEFLEPEDPQKKNEEKVYIETVENTHSEIETFGFGGSYNHDNGYVGLSFSNYSSEYGVPNHEDSVVAIEKEKIALESAYDIDSGYFDSVHFKLAYGDYSHTEEAGHEEHGEEITLYEYHSDEGEFDPHEHDDHHHAKFLLEGIDSKLVFSKNTDTDSSALSLSFVDKDMKIDGEESYLAAMNHLANQNDENSGTLDESENPKISNDSAKRFGIGFMQKKQLSEQLSLNGGFRYESLSRDYDASERVDEHAHSGEGNAVDIDRDDNALNASIGFVMKSSDCITFSGNLHYSERIPETSELYSSGAHHATESFEIGNPDLKNEESVGVEFTVSNTQGAFNQKLSLYYNKYNNFIFQSDTGFKTGSDKWRLATAEDSTKTIGAVDENGDVIDPPITLIPGEDFVKAEFEELSIRAYKGVEAKIYGLEYEFDYQLSSNTSIRGFADSITGKNKTDAIALPRIPPYRLGIGYYLNSDQYRFSLNAVHHGKQDKLADGEEETNAYTLLDARLGFSPNSNRNSELYLKINNLTDRLAYVHTSFLKESAPLPGRNVEIGYNITF